MDDTPTERAFPPHMPKMFSPWEQGPKRHCRECAHSIGWQDGLLCTRIRLAPNGYPCGQWERAPGADDEVPDRVG